VYRVRRACRRESDLLAGVLMPPVQLARLRPQVNALMSHYEDQALFSRTLLLILEKYSEKFSQRPGSPGARAPQRLDPELPAYNVPPVVLNELESALEALAKLQPQQSACLADVMWAQPSYESKKLAIFLLARLPAGYQGEFIARIQRWFAGGIPNISQSLIAEFIQQSSQKLEIISSRAWLALLRAWIASEDKRLQQIGMQAAGDLAANRAFQNLPLVFELAAPLYSQPKITLQKDLAALTRRLIERSQPETASFLISLVELSQKPAVSALVRKLLPLFDEYYREEIRKAVI
jgi:hypothetical protein